MSDNDETQQSDQIQPASISFSPEAETRARGTAEVPLQMKLILWAGFALLLLLAAGVFLVLPKMVQTPTAPRVASEPAASATPRPRAAPKPTPPPTTAVEDVEQARLRKLAQEHLHRILELKTSLESKHVEQWADSEYKAAVNLVETGEQAYNRLAYGEAAQTYAAAAEQLGGLDERAHEVFLQALADGDKALTVGNAAAAVAAFELALLLEPDDEKANKGLKRAQSLDEVLALLDSGRKLDKQGQFEDARKHYQQALSLDPEMTEAATLISAVNRKIVERNFTRAMSDGYAALEKQELSRARKAFAQALKIKPRAKDAQEAIAQVQNLLTSGQIGQLLREAQRYETNEQWWEAAVKYDEARKLDPNLAAAQQGKQRARERADLEAKLEQFMARVEALQSQDVYNEASAIHRQVTQVSNPGPKLKKQVAALAVVLEKAGTAIKVQLQSDSFTDVTVYKVGKLGKFQNRELSLLPGKYVAVGVRRGYRDARVEFTVSDKTLATPIVVQCRQRI